MAFRLKDTAKTRRAMRAFVILFVIGGISYNVGVVRFSKSPQTPNQNSGQIYQVTIKGQIRYLAKNERLVWGIVSNGMTVLGVLFAGIVSIRLIFGQEKT